jgi:hypothetical protein
MQVGVDQRRQNGWTFEGGVEGRAHLAQERQIGPETCGDDQLVGLDMSAATR